MAELGSRGVEEAVAALASPREPAAAGVASALTAAAAAGVVELAAGLAANRLNEQGPDAGHRMRELVHQAGKLRARLLASADEDARAYARVAKTREGRDRARALDRASDPPLAIAERAAAVAERAAEVVDAGDWTFTADAVVAGELAAAAARGCARLVEANLADVPEDPRPARARAAADSAAGASRSAADRAAKARRSTADSTTG